MYYTFDMHIQQLELNTLRMELQSRARASHKGNFGHVLVIGGEYGYAGATVMAALGALRIGAGLVTIATHKEHLYGLNATHPEIMGCAIDNPASLDKIIPHATVIVIGPGLGRSNWSQEVYNQVKSLQQPQIIDADALYFLARNPIQNKKRILTPHPGEAKTLLGKNIPITEEERIECIQELQKKYNCTVLLKGANTLVASPGVDISVCTFGNPGMASGGMGDLLSGVIAGLVAQGMNMSSATKLGVIIHATAGDMAKVDGERGLLATDLLPHIRKLIG